MKTQPDDTQRISTAKAAGGSEGTDHPPHVK